MKVFPAKNKISRTLSYPPTMLTNANITGYNYRYDPVLNTYFTRGVMPYMDTLSCIRPSFKYSNYITVLSAGWYTNSLGYFNNSTIYSPPLSAGWTNFVWRELVVNTKGLTAFSSVIGVPALSTTTLRIIGYPSMPSVDTDRTSFFAVSGGFSKPYYNFSPTHCNRTVGGALIPTSNAVITAFSDFYYNDSFYNLRDTVTNKLLFPQPLSSVWMINDEPVPNTSNLITSNSPYEDSILQFSISAQNYRGIASYTGWPMWISSYIYDFAQNMAQNVITRTTNMPGGSASMNMFSVKNHTTNTYVRSPDLWANDIIDQFTGCAVYKSGYYESYGGVLITPRHVLYINHAHPQAPCDLRFVRSDNVSVSCTQLHQAGFEVKDLAVGLVDRDMQALGLHVVPISTMLTKTVPFAISSSTGLAKLARLSTVIQSLTSEKYAAIPFVAVSQGVGRETTTIPNLPGSKYPRYNDIMLHIATPLQYYDPTTTYSYKLSNFAYSVWDGDSGTPVFFIVNNTAYLTGIMQSAPWGLNFFDITTVNQLITAADANAIAMGRLAEPTGYTVTDIVNPSLV